MVNRQITLKPQDLLVLMKLHLLRGESFTYASVANSLSMSASEVHASLKRTEIARLVGKAENGLVTPVKTAFREFLLYGARYAFPAVLGPISRGIPTAFAVEPLRGKLVHAEDAPVWPYAKGDARGPALYPLYPTVPGVASEDRGLYEFLALFDGIRIGTARERDVAIGLLSERLT